MTEAVEKRLYELMVLMKAADDRLSKGIGTGEFMCVYWPSRGQEAIAAAMGVALRTDDQLVTTYRGLHDLIGKGVPLEEIYGEMMGRTTGASRGKGGTMHIAKPENGVMLSTGIVGAGPPVAVGLAMSAKRKGLDRVTVVSFGDGATNTGSFHESLNLASLWATKTLFVCENNEWAESTPGWQHSPVYDDMSRRAAAYKMEAVKVDGQDVERVYEAAHDALERVRSGAGPVFLDIETYRMHGHYIGDPQVYRSKADRDEAAERDPIVRLRERLGVPAQEWEALEAEVHEIVEAAVEFARNGTDPQPEDALKNVYA